MNPDVLIFDGYVDEPALLGVPPYISPEPRLLAGVAEEHGLDWGYITVDEWREKGLPRCKILLVHGGVTVPGRYLSGTPLSPKEARELAASTATTFISGPLARYREMVGFDHVVKKDISAYFNDHLKGAPKDRWYTDEERERWLVKGASVVKEHPMLDGPLIAEVVTYRGCVRYFTGGCFFCSEPSYGKPVFRAQEDIHREIEELYIHGVRNFRLGGQSCIMSYRAEGVGNKERPRPAPDELELLFKGIWDRCPDIQVLHVDNANPAIMSEYPDETRDILESLVEWTTPGNVIALGMESADPEVIEACNLNAYPDDVERAIKLTNEVGRERGYNGMPHLLPGINFIAGLPSERPQTFEKNIQFLRRIKDQGLLLRRINIRQMRVDGYEQSSVDPQIFRKFKKDVREEIDRPMLKRMLPLGTVLSDVYMEKRDGKTTFGRQVGSYPILVGIKYPLDLGKFYDVIITGHGYRSVTGIHHPFYLDDADYRQLSAIPGIGKKRAASLFRKMPSNKEELKKVIDGNAADEVLIYIRFKEDKTLDG